MLAVAAAGGMGTMAVELSAVRMLAPWFGTSLTVWTNVIGVILLGLALGYLAGARLAATRRPLLALGLVLFGAAAFTAWLPILAQPICGAFMPRGVALHESAGLLQWGSLASATLLFLPPALLLGMVGPVAVEAVQRLTGGRAGSAGGSVLATSTLGSLVGTFGTTHFTLPRLGLGASFLLAGSLLALAGAVALLLAFARRERPRVGGVLGLLLGAGLVAGSALPETTPRALDEGLVLLAAKESPYQSVRVVEDRRGPSPLRYLQVNEGFDSFQSVWQVQPGLLPEGYYYNDFALPVWWAQTPEPRLGDWRVLVLGLGAGTAVRVLEGALPPGVDLVSTGVELDPVVVELAREHMDLADRAPSRTVHSGEDARYALAQLAGPYDQIVLDAYANQVEIPPHLATVEFFRELRPHLSADGWLCVNVGGFGFDDPVVSALGTTIATAFDGSVLALRVPSSRNFVLFAREGKAPPRPGTAAWENVPDPYAALLLAKREVPSAWRWFRPTARTSRPGMLSFSEDPVLTDDRSNIDLRQLRSIAEGAARLRGDDS